MLNVMSVPENNIDYLVCCFFALMLFYINCVEYYIRKYQRIPLWRNRRKMVSWHWILELLLFCFFAVLHVMLLHCVTCIYCLSCFVAFLAPFLTYIMYYFVILYAWSWICYDLRFELHVIFTYIIVTFYYKSMQCDCVY